VEARVAFQFQLGKASGVAPAQIILRVCDFFARRQKPTLKRKALQAKKGWHDLRSEFATIFTF
jgi:hypothetical protein